MNHFRTTCKQLYTKTVLLTWCIYVLFFPPQVWRQKPRPLLLNLSHLTKPMVSYCQTMILFNLSFLCTVCIKIYHKFLFPIQLSLCSDLDSSYSETVLLFYLSIQLSLHQLKQICISILIISLDQTCNGLNFSVLRNAMI